MIVAILAIGIARISFAIKGQTRNEAFFKSYCEHFKAMISSHNAKESKDDADWLIVNSHAMNDLLGPYGMTRSQARELLSVPIHHIPELCCNLNTQSLSFMDEERCKVVIRFAWYNG